MERKILVADDDPDILELLQLALADSGYLTSTATTGEATLQAARLSRPDLVLLDLMLPDTNGLSVLEMLRSDPITASIPVILMTAMPGTFPRLAGLELGAAGFVNKPFELSELISSIRDALDPSRVNPRSFATARRVAAAA
jgi:DNA-binding response OmpR family regulator